MSGPLSGLPLRAELVEAAVLLGYTSMTPVQAQALPPMLDGRDVIAQARTGSGKTAAFGLALLARVEPTLQRVQALVLCPTRELADQVAKEIRRLARLLPNVKLLTLTGGISLRPQLASLEHDPQIVVGTPGRVQEHLRKRSLHLDALRVLVLDEADRMLDMGFIDAIGEIIDRAPVSRQTLLFSATYAEEVRAVSRRFQREPLTVTVDAAEAQPQIAQQFFEVDLARKLDALCVLLSRHRPESVLVFCKTRRDVQEVAAGLAQRRFAVVALHGDLEQRERDEVLVLFGNGSASVLVATDLAARGLDIAELPMVISYELSEDPDVHLHRVGRTGRAGRAGLALHLCSPRERPRAQAVEMRMNTTIDWQRLTLPERAGDASGDRPLTPAMSTLCIDAGRRDKLRPGDILGALTGDAGFTAAQVGKINVYDTRAYVALERSIAGAALRRLRDGRIKGRSFRVRGIG